MLKSFTLRLVIFTLPMVTVLGMLWGALFVSGDLRSPLRLIATHLQQPKLLYAIPDLAVLDYKSVALPLVAPDVVAMGSSRVLQLRQAMFTNATFYNLGIANGNMFYANYYVDQMNERGDYPAVILLGVDLDWFHRIDFGGAHYKSGQRIGTWKHTLTFADLLNQTRLLTANLLEGKVTYDDLLSRDASRFGDDYLRIGTQTLLRGDGFRSDGSYYYYTVTRSADFSEPLYDLEDVRSGNDSRFNPATQADPRALEQLAQLVAMLKALPQVTVIAFSPPYAPQLYDQMEASGEYTYFDEVRRTVRGYEDERFWYFDFSSGDFADLRNVHYIDAFHGSELVYTIILQEMAKQVPALANMTDVDWLQAQLDQRPHHPYVVFDPVPLAES
jgi:hypothetical protein